MFAWDQLFEDDDLRKGRRVSGGAEFRSLDKSRQRRGKEKFKDWIGGSNNADDWGVLM